MENRTNHSNSSKKIICPHCKLIVPEMEFCIKCGKKMENEMSEGLVPQLTIRECPNCKRSVPSTDFCINCGKKMEKEDDNTSSLLKQVDFQTKMITCPLCRQSIPDQHQFCHLCGAKLSKSKEDQTETIICNRCWKTNPPNTGYCLHCGAVTLGKFIYKAQLLEKPFEGYQFELSQFFKPATLPISTLRQDITSRNFPIKSIITHSEFFGVRTKKPELNFFSRNFGVFNRYNIWNYFITFIFLLSIYSFWYFSRFIETSNRIDLISEVLLLLLSSGFLTILLMIPIWFSTFFVYRNTGYRLNFKLNPSKVFVTVILNLLWLFLPYGFGPILLRMGEFTDDPQKIINEKSFNKGIVLGAILVVGSSLVLAILTVLVVGVPGIFVGFLFQNNILKGHILASYFGATWVILLLLLPFGDYFDRILKQWNLLGYIIMLMIGFFLLIYSFNLMRLLFQVTYRA